MNDKRFLSDRFRSLSLYLLLAVPLLYFVTKNNFLVDDWAQLSNGETLEQQVNSWKSLWSYRPVSWLLIPFFLHLLNDNFVLLAVLHTSIYGFSIFQILNWKVLSLNQAQKRIAAILILSPVFSSSFLLSPVNQLSASLSLFFFACGLLLEKKTSSIVITQTGTNLLFLLSVLSYEISLPFIFMHYLFSIRKRNRFAINFISFPVLLFVVYIWQKIIAPNYLDSDFSRFGSLAFLPLLSFVFSYLVAIPQFIIVKLISSTLIVFLVAGLVIYASSRNTFPAKNVDRDKLSSLIVLAGFLSNGALFLFSGRFSQITGYGNRGLTSSWIIFSILIVIFIGTQKNLKFFILVIFVSANYLLFWDKLTESASASEARTSVISELLNVSSVGSSKSKTLVLDLPCFLPGSKFRTEIFCTAWDARGALKKSGLDVEQVLLLEDRGFVGYMQNIDLAETVTLIEFTKDFEISGIRLVDPAYREKIFSPYSEISASRDIEIQECLARTKELLSLQVSGELRNYLDCVEPLLLPDE